MAAASGRFESERSIEERKEQTRLARAEALRQVFALWGLFLARNCVGSGFAGASPPSPPLSELQGVCEGSRGPVRCSGRPGCPAVRHSLGRRVPDCLSPGPRSQSLLLSETPFSPGTLERRLGVEFFSLSVWLPDSWKRSLTATRIHSTIYLLAEVEKHCSTH